MNWTSNLFDISWSQEISNYDEKKAVAQKIAMHVKDGDAVGFGSGSTSFLAVQEIAARVKAESLHITAIPTSFEINNVCNALGIPTRTINELKPDWAFDGADEVDPSSRLIKGRGGAMFNEKVIMSNSPKTYIMVDKSKFVTKLCEKFPIPVECVPSALTSVKSRLLELGASSVVLRLAGKSKDGPVITENGNYIVDAVFESVADSLEKEIKSVVGVIESGLFIGYDIEIISI